MFKKKKFRYLSFILFYFYVFKFILKIIFFFFLALRTMSVRPNYGPSTGGTLISLLGIGFADT
jgi:hypothetical protein